MNDKQIKPFVAQCLFCLNGMCTCTARGACPTKGLEPCVGINAKNTTKGLEPCVGINAKNTTK